LADSHLPIFLLHGYDTGEPFCVLGLLDETRSEKFIYLGDDAVLKLGS
jgi:hypothetical protein